MANKIAATPGVDHAKGELRAERIRNGLNPDTGEPMPPPPSNDISSMGIGGLQAPVNPTAPGMPDASGYVTVRIPAAQAVPFLLSENERLTRENAALKNQPNQTASIAALQAQVIELQKIIDTYEESATAPAPVVTPKPKE